MRRTEIKFNLPVSILKENKSFVAYTPALDLSTSGQSYAEVKKRFEEIVSIFFEELVKKGTLEEVLRELGWKKISAGWRPPVVIAHNLETFQVPVNV